MRSKVKRASIGVGILLAFFAASTGPSTAADIAPQLRFKALYENQTTTPAESTRHSLTTILSDLRSSKFLDTHFVAEDEQGPTQSWITIGPDGSWRIFCPSLDREFTVNSVSGKSISVGKVHGRRVLQFEDIDPIEGLFEEDIPSLGALVTPIERRYAKQLEENGLGEERSFILRLVYGSLADGEVVEFIN